MANNTNNTQEKKDQAAKSEEVKPNNKWSEKANKEIREELKKQK